MTSEYTDEFYANGNLWARTYRKDGNLHREPKEGPAVTYYHECGHKEREDYYVEDKFHRDPKEGPAIIWYREDGSKCSEIYYVEGKHLPFIKRVVNWFNRIFSL